MAKDKSITMNDVAREAGVSLGTVSKVMNGIPVGEAYRIRVEAAVEKLGYRINHYAKGLRGHKTDIIAVMIPNLTNPFFGQLVNELCSELTIRDRRTLLCTTDFDSPQQQTRAVRMIMRQMVDGIICCSYNPKLRVRGSVPMVSIDHRFGLSIPCVTSDNYGGGMLAAHKLAENGCKNVAFFHIGPDLTSEISKRQDGFLSGCADLNLPCQSISISDGTPQAIFEQLKNSHDGKMDIDGIFCVSDDLACKAIAALESMGLHVPEDVQVIGYDGIRRIGDGTLFCSTIVQPVPDIARTCVSVLLDSLQHTAPCLSTLPVRYAPGGTTRDDPSHIPVRKPTNIRSRL